MSDLDKLENLDARYCIYGYETGAEGTVHLQGYVEFGKVMRIKAACDKLGGRAHLEARRGTREQARDYCKKDEEFIEFGEWEKGGQGTRTDLAGLMDMIKKKASKLDMMEASPAVYANNMKFVEAYTAELEKVETRKFRKVECHVIWGDAGVGKTRKVVDMAPNVFRVNPSEAFPFDGYDGEKDILFDDFYGEMRHSTMLRILDGYQYRVNVKFGHRYACWNRVFITSNKQPSEWYQFGLTPALARRINSVEFVTKSCNEEGVIVGPSSENDNINFDEFSEFFDNIL